MPKQLKERVGLDAGQQTKRRASLAILCAAVVKLDVTGAEQARTIAAEDTTRHVRRDALCADRSRFAASRHDQSATAGGARRM